MMSIGSTGKERSAGDKDSTDVDSSASGPLEGVVARRLNERYRPGERTWSKRKNSRWARYQAEREAAAYFEPFQQQETVRTSISSISGPGSHGPCCGGGSRRDHG